MTYRPTAVRRCPCILVAMLAACPIAAGATGASPSGIDACLPSALPDPAVLFSSQKKVFAHYFYPFPLSLDNKPAVADYYNRNYLDKNGEAGKWLAKGGFLRQRPLEVPVGSPPDWQMMNMEREIKMAIARGITGFTVDILSGKEGSNPNSHLNMLLSAAQAVDARFKIVVMPDLVALKTDSDSVVQIIATAAASPAAYRLSDGRLVVTAFHASANPPQWWESVFAQLKSRGISVAFVPTFLGWGKQAGAFAYISEGFGDWGTATESASKNTQGDAAAAHSSYGKIYMLPVDPQQYRPKEGTYWEAGNSATFRNSWMSAIQGGADWVQLVTWSDFSESSEIEPYTDATLRRDIGTGFYDLNAYYATWFLTGTQPSITHDVLYYFYRREPTAAASPAQSAPNRVVSGSPADNIELLAFLTAPGVLKVDIGGQSYTQNAPAGITSFKVASRPGMPVFSLTRSGSPVISFQGPIQIFDQGGIPSGVIDMTYWSGSASKSGVCSL
jgi:Glycosyl hydrolase family 71